MHTYNISIHELTRVINKLNRYPCFWQTYGPTYIYGYKLIVCRNKLVVNTCTVWLTCFFIALQFVYNNNEVIQLYLVKPTVIVSTYLLTFF